MNESMGTVPVIVVIMIFIVAVSGYIAYTVNYSKAFKAKSEIINIIQQNKNDVKGVLATTAERLKTVQYSAAQEYLAKYCSEDDGWKLAGSQGWCYKVITTSGSENDCDVTDKKYVKIRTIISIDVPVLKQIFSNMSLFIVEGSTKSTACK